MLFMLISPFLVGYTLNRKSDFSYYMQWLIGLLTITVLLMIMHGLGLSKVDTFNAIYLLTIGGLFLGTYDLYTKGIKYYLDKGRAFFLTFSLSYS